ncbi:MAG: hypothetical protein M3Z23_12995 [Acidobacteriota bacterium]|nr:hypothetical protein [Acidobacteriota bacterium]
MRDTGAMIGGLIPSARFTTSIILLINIALFAASSLGGAGLLYFGAKDGRAIFLQHGGTGWSPPDFCTAACCTLA